MRKIVICDPSVYADGGFSPKGELKGLAEATRKDINQKKNFFDINGKAVVVDYSCTPRH
ncbi:MAG: hypothetical protein V8S22_00570 [Lachnospiraceae bacterium]